MTTKCSAHFDDKQPRLSPTSRGGYSNWLITLRPRDLAGLVLAILGSVGSGFWPRFFSRKKSGLLVVESLMFSFIGSFSFLLPFLTLVESPRFDNVSRNLYVLRPATFLGNRFSGLRHFLLVEQPKLGAHMPELTVMKLPTGRSSTLGFTEVIFTLS